MPEKESHKNYKGFVAGVFSGIAKLMVSFYLFGCSHISDHGALKIYIETRSFAEQESDKALNT